MPSKYQEYRQMADTAERQLTSSYKSWTQFLRTAARLYKYPYNEQVMIHAQRPDATACAEYDFWNKKMGRFVRRGSTGIALIDTSGQKPQLRYVFDVADTGEREHSRPVHLWRFRAEHEDIVAATLERSYDVSVSDGIVEQMESAATQLAKEYWADHKRDILHNIDDSYLDGYDEFNTEVQFRNAAKVSITYMLMSRCGLEPEAYMEPEDFMPVFDFNTPAAVAALGTAVSEISQQVLRQIEVAIRNYERERSQNHDRIDLHEERRLPDSRPEAERGTGEQAPGQVRDAAKDLPSGASPHPLEPDDPVRDAVSAPAGDRRDGAPEAGTDDAGADAVGGRDGSAESQRPIDVGGADEQLQGTGGRDHSERAGVQLTNDAPEAEPAQPTAAYQMSLFPTEEEQIAYIDTAESVNSTPSAFSMFISQDDIDHILRTGGNADDARMKIVAEFSKQKPIEDRAAFLKNLYYGGNGLITENGRFSAWYGNDGIHIANGDAARYLRSAQVISWTDAAERIDELLDSGTFATNLEVTEAPRYERLSIAVAVWNLYHDFSDEAKSLGYLSCLGNIHSTNFPEETERLTDDLLNPEFREQFLTEYKIFLDAYRENRELLRFHFHRPQALLTRMEDLSLPRKEYHSDMAAVPETGRFITGDEIAASLANGSGFEDGKARIYEFFQTPHTPKESADFLKKEYGIGGRTHAVSRESGSYEDHGSKGITLKKNGCADIQMNWNKVASRISELIRLNRYLTPYEQAAYDKAMEQDVLRNAVYNDYRKDFFDLAVGNVPFGQYQVDDRAYNKLGFSIHDYFFAKTLDQVRPGGVIAFVTSRYTMDKQSPEVRRYIAQRAELLGAIRLPNNAFRANAGTDVVSDIVFLQRRDRPIEIDEDWIHLGQSENGFAINSYFAEHPEMVLGTPSSESTQYGKQDYTVNPIEGADLGTLLHEAVQNIGGKYQEAELPDLGENEKIGTSIPADPNVKNFSYTIVDGDVYYRENSVMVKPDLNATAKARVKGMVQLRDCVQKLIGQQLDGFVSDEAIQRTQRELDALYDSFTEKYGLINTRANNLAFSDDSSYFLLCSLEVLDEENNLKRKADIFTKRTIRPHEAITSVDTASEALALSISEKACVDMDYMAQLSGKGQEELIDELNGVIFLDPVHGEWQTADEYLSGDVRQKLREAEAAAKDSPGYLPNVEALRQAQPKDLDASEIEVRLGATWIDKAYIKQFMFELLEPAFYVRRSIDVNYSDFSAEWNITGKSVVGRSDINANMTYGTERANAYKILEDTLNLRDVRIYDTITDADGKEKRVLNSKETTLAQQKQQAIKDAFQEWIWKDPTRRHELVQKYTYSIEKIETLNPSEVDAVQNSGYDLVLYTCTKGGRTRVTVFCNRIKIISPSPAPTQMEK